jgi:hypothetical protein
MDQDPALWTDHTAAARRVFRADSALTWLFLYGLVPAALLLLRFSYPAEQPRLSASATLDTHHLRQILRNRCATAFKHGNRIGAPPQAVLRAARDGRSGAVQLDMMDTGPGSASTPAPRAA